MIAMKLTAVKNQFFDRLAVSNEVDRAEKKVMAKAGAFVRTSARSSIRKRKKPSAPGSPPSSHTGLLKRNIFFAYEPSAHTVVIGPILLNKSTGAPETLEKGGNAQIVSVKLRRGKKPRRVKRAVSIAARPFMGPALEREQPKVADLWKNAVSN